ncbi:MAG: RNA methyltransferase [Candidatus Omnitrophica bacterium]|nr:RNA methyltransferase [Candidatus Omnitrophota bacterium]
MTDHYKLTTRQLEQRGLFIAESERVFRRLIDTDLEIVSCIVTESISSRLKKELSSLRKKGIPVDIGTKAQLTGFTGYPFHEGLLAAVKRPEKRTARQVFPPAGKRKKRSFLVVLNGVTDPMNVGMIVRSAAAFGATGMVVDALSCDPFYRKSVRISIGTVFTMPIAYEDTLSPALEYLKKEMGLKVIVTAPGRGSADIAKADLAGNICLVLGNEGYGCGKDVMRCADMKVRIPVSKEVESINVACAASIFLARAGA